SRRTPGQHRVGGFHLPEDSRGPRREQVDPVVVASPKAWTTSGATLVAPIHKRSLSTERRAAHRLEGTRVGMSAATKATEGSIDANGLQFRYQEWGDTRTKHAVIMLHGYAETKSMWEETA